ncbi:extracellular solute-binding protein [Puniceicoccaceae bacterium K14]|nr:extracellular solute-binding protein [Puniceicoccaceae bacterium K14]
MLNRVYLITGSLVALSAYAIFAWLDHRALSAADAAAAIANPESVDWLSIEDDPERLIEISWMPLPRYPNGLEGAYGEVVLEKRFNVDIQPILLDKPGYPQRKPLMFAAGDIPDIVWDGNPSDVQKDIYHGCIRPIPIDLIKKYAPNYFKLISDFAPMGWLYADYAGENWGLPVIWADGGLPTPGVWRKDWLEAVGIEKEPETLAEFEEAFRRFAFDDPDGNGKNDTYGLTNTTIGWHLMFSEFFGAYGVLPFDWVERDGSIVWGGITSEAKEVLALLQRWNAEGVLDPEWITDGLGEKRRLKEKLMNGRVGYAYGMAVFNEFDTSSPKSLVSVLEGLNPEAVAVPAKLPVGPDGQRGVRNWGRASNTYVAGPGVVAEPLKLIRTLKMMEYQVGNGMDVYLESMYGKRGTHWDYANGNPSEGITRLAPFVEERSFQQKVLSVWTTEHPVYHEKSHAAAESAFNEKFRNPKHCLFNAIGRPEMVPSAQLYLEDLRAWQMNVYTEIIRGNFPIEYFDEFAEEWLLRGGAEMTEEAQGVMLRKNEIFASLGIENEEGGQR